MARGVLWDVGNVIVRWNPRTLYSKVFDDPAVLDHFLTEVCPLSWNFRSDGGEPFSDLIAEAQGRYPHYAKEIAYWHDRWPEMASGSIIETVDAIRALDAAGVPQFGLTNMSHEVWPRCRALDPVFGLLRDVVVSGVEGVTKPDRRIFEIAVARVGLPAEDILFIDDSPANIAGAAAVDFDTHLFDDPSTLLPALQARGLL